MMHQRNISRIHWMFFLGICVSQMQIASASPVTVSITAPTTIIGTETVYPSLTLTSSSAENTYVSTTSASNTATEFVDAYTTVDPRSTVGNETFYSSFTITTFPKVSSRSSSAPETTQLMDAEYNISTAHEITTSFYTQMTSSVGESPASTSTSTDQTISDTTTTLKASSTTKTTSTPETASNTGITSTTETTSTTGTTSTTETISTTGTTSTPETTSTTGTTSTPETTSTTETTSTPETASNTGTSSTTETTSTTGTTSTTETTSTTHCTTSTPKKPKKDCVIDDPDFLDQLRQELTNDEGYKDEIYVDTSGNPTFGIGHKITRKDPEFGKPLGTKVSKERIEEAFKADVKAAIESCCKLFKNFQNLPKEVKLIILNMSFNLGHTGLAKFAKFRDAVNRGDWEKAADEMEHSKWYNQVPDRAKRLVERMRKVGKEC